jgi:hypothetical protein
MLLTRLSLLRNPSWQPRRGAEDAGSGIGKARDSLRFQRNASIIIKLRHPPSRLPHLYSSICGPCLSSRMSSTQAPEKPLTEKQRLKLEKFKQKQESLAAKQTQQTLDKKARRLAPPTVSAKDWIEETPAGQRKILKPLDDDFHKAYLPNVVESAWYSFWENQGLFKPQTEKDGSIKPKGKYVIAMPPPNVCAYS